MCVTWSLAGAQVLIFSLDIASKVCDQVEQKAGIKGRECLGL